MSDIKKRDTRKKDNIMERNPDMPVFMCGTTYGDSDREMCTFRRSPYGERI